MNDDGWVEVDLRQCTLVQYGPAGEKRERRWWRRVYRVAWLRCLLPSWYVHLRGELAARDKMTAEELRRHIQDENRKWERAQRDLQERLRREHEDVWRKHLEDGDG